MAVPFLNRFSRRIRHYINIVELKQWYYAQLYRTFQSLNVSFITKTQTPKLAVTATRLEHQRVAICIAAGLGHHGVHASRRVSVVRLPVQQLPAVAALRVRIGGRLDDDKRISCMSRQRETLQV